MGRMLHRQQQGNRETPSSMRVSEELGESGVYGRLEGVDAAMRVEGETGEMDVEVNRRAQLLLRGRVQWLGDEMKRWVWRDTG